MRAEAIPREIDFVKVGSVAAFLLVPTVLVALASMGALTDADPRTEGQEFLRDIADNKNYATALTWLLAFAGLLIVPVFLGLYHGLRSWGESYMRVAVVAGLVAAVLLALTVPPHVTMLTYILPGWSEASDDATRALLLSDLTTLAWLDQAVHSMFDVAIAIATMAASVVMLRLRSRLWLGTGWVGMVGGLAGIVGAFTLAEEGLWVAGSVLHPLLALIWLLGLSFGLWRLPAAEMGGT